MLQACNGILGGRQGDDEGSSIVGLAFSRYDALVFVNDLFGYGQADASSLVLFPRVQALKQGKYLSDVFLIEADPVVVDSDAVKITGTGGRAFRVNVLNSFCTNVDHRDHTRL